MPFDVRTHARRHPNPSAVALISPRQRWRIRRQKRCCLSLAQRSARSAARGFVGLWLQFEANMHATARHATVQVPALPVAAAARTRSTAGKQLLLKYLTRMVLKHSLQEPPHFKSERTNARMRRMLIHGQPRVALHSRACAHRPAVAYRTHQSTLARAPEPRLAHLALRHSGQLQPVDLALLPANLPG